MGSVGSRATKLYLAAVVLAALGGNSSVDACTATITVQKVDGLVTYDIHAQASCSPDWWNYIYVYSREDGGPWGLAGGGKGTVADIHTSHGTVCMSEGLHSIEIQADCTVDSSCPVKETPATASGTFQVKWDLGFGVTYPDKDNALIHVTRNVDSGNNIANPNAPALVRFVSLPSGRIIYDENLGNGLEGDLQKNRTPLAGDTAILVQSIACGAKVTKEAILAPVCPNCPKWPTLSGAEPDPGASCDLCKGDPVNLWTGAVEYSERDPLPDTLGYLSKRWYNNQVGDGWFLKWRSIFDARAAFSATTDYVSVTLPTGMPFMFRRAGAGYFQVWPVNGAPATLTLDSSYRFRMAGDRALWTFSATDGTLEDVHDVTNGRGYRFSWQAGVPTTVEDLNGNWILDVSASGETHRVDGLVVRGAGSSVQYGYVGSELRTVSVSGTSWRRYSYVSGNLSSVSDADGRTLEWHDYDGGEGSRARDSYGPSGDISAITYGAGRVPGEMATHVTWATGSTVTHYLRTVANADVRTVEIVGGCSSCSENAVFSYDASGNLLREQNNRGYITERTFAAGKLITKTDNLRPAGCDPEAAPQRCRLSVEALGTATLEPTSATVVTTYSYDDPLWPDFVTTRSRASVLVSGQMTTEITTYDPSGAVFRTSVEGWTGSPSRKEVRVTDRTLYDGVEGAAFNPGGAFSAAWVALAQPRLMKTADGPRTDVADVITNVYYPVHDSVPGPLRGRLAATRNAAGQITRFESYDAFGNVLRLVDPNGVVNESTYDAFGRVTSTSLRGVPGCDIGIDPLCATDITTTRSYENGTGPLLAETHALGVTTYEYDSRSRLTAINRGPSTNDLRERIEYSYDPASGQKTSERYLARESGDWIEKRRETYEYDTERRLSSVTHADNTTVAYTYDPAGAMATLKDERHSSPNTFYRYDPAGRLTEVRQTLSTAPGGAIATSYAYDLAGNLTSVTDPNGNVTTYLYDDFSQMLRQVSPVTGTTTYSYDPGGNLVSTFDANGASTVRGYDALSRVISSTSTAPGKAADLVTYTYDSPGSFAIGRLSTVSDPTGGTAYGYERRGLLATEQKTIDGTSYSTSYRYDADGNRSGITYPSGRVVTYSFDYAGRPIGAASGGAPLVSSAKYLPLGPMTEMVLANGTVRTTQFDARYLPLSNQLTGPSGTIASYGYDTDAGGNILSIHDLLEPAYNRDFGYDDLSRLTTANSGISLWGTGSYAYDAMGNVQTLALGTSRTASFSYAGSTPKLTNVLEGSGNRAATYDAAGNQTNIGTDLFSFGSRNQLQDATGWTYRYDHRGVRVTSSAAPVATVTGLGVSPSSVQGGTAVTGTVTLDSPAPAGGATVCLDSANHAAVLLPRSVVIPEGSVSANFTISTTSQRDQAVVAVRATHAASSQTASVTIEAQPRVTGLTLSPSRVNGGGTATGTVTLNRQAPPGGVTVTLTNSDPATVTVPSSVTVPESAATAQFSISAGAVQVSTDVVVSATLVDSVSATLSVISGALEVESVAVSPATAFGGHGNATLAVTLTAEAPPGGTVVALGSSDPSAATAPASLTIPAGSATGSATVTTSPVSTPVGATLSATHGTTRSCVLNVLPCTGWTGSPALLGGESVWFDDQPPAGTLSGTWLWDTSQKTSGSASHYDPASAGAHSHTLTNVSYPLAVGDELTAYVLVDPCDPPREILLQWFAVDNNSWDTWEHRAYWGEESFHNGTEGTPSLRRFGDVPAGGQWVRLTVPSSRVNLAGKVVHGMDFSLSNGKAWFDRVGATACNAAQAPPPASFPAADQVWFDDELPPGAVPQTAWVWTPAQYASGSQSHTDAEINGAHGHYFTSASRSLGVGDTSVVYALVDPCNPPDEIMLQWFEPSTGWEHRAYWGQELFHVGVEGTAGMKRIGDVPAAGSWVRLEIPAAEIGMEGRTATGFYLGVVNGRAWFDRVSVAPAGSGAMRRAPVRSGDDSEAEFSWSRLLLGRSRTPVSFAVTAKFTKAAPVSTTAGSVRRDSLYSPELNLIAETSSGVTPAIAYEYVWFGGQPLAQIETATNTVHTYFNDHLGTPILTTDGTGAVDWRIEREPYGGSYRVRTGFDRHQPLAFPGQEVSGEGEMSYNIFRWYRAAWGQYTQPDPIGIGGGTTLSLNHLYRFGDNSPVVNSDPTGLYTLSANCDSKLCGPPSPGMCGSNPGSAVCLAELFKKLRDMIRTNKKCKKALDQYGKGFNATDVIRSTFPGLGGPLINCNKDDCKGKGDSLGEYNYMTHSIPACLTLYDPGSTLLHEVLHDFGIADKSAEQTKILTSCYENSIP